MLNSGTVDLDGQALGPRHVTHMPVYTPVAPRYAPCGASPREILDTTLAA